MAKPNVVPRVTSPAESVSSGPHAISEPVTNTSADAGVASASGATDTKPKAPRGPVLKWNSDRERALTNAFAVGNTSGTALLAALQADPSFADAAGQLTVSKIRTAVTRLRKAGVSLPKLTGRGGGGHGGTKRQVDVEGLNAILAAGVSSQPSA